MRSALWTAAAAIVAVAALAAWAPAGEAHADGAYFIGGTDGGPPIPNTATVTLNYPAQGQNLVATITLDAPAEGTMKFFTEVYECVVRGTAWYSGFGAWQKNMCSENNATRHASLDVGDGRDFSRYTIYPTESDKNNTINGQHYIHTMKMITINEGQSTGTAQ